MGDRFGLHTHAPSDEHGEFWHARAFGFERGQIVERGPYDLLVGQCKAPDGTLLGGPLDSSRKIADSYARLLAAEPHATADRKHELRKEAARKARQSQLFFDLTDRVLQRAADRDAGLEAAD